MSSAWGKETDFMIFSTPLPNFLRESLLRGFHVSFLDTSDENCCIREEERLAQMKSLILSPHRILREQPHELGQRERKAELIDVKTKQVLRHFNCEFGVDDSKRIITSSWREGQLTLTVYNLDGQEIHTETIPCVDHYNVGKWQEIHTTDGIFDLY